MPTRANSATLYHCDCDNSKNQLIIICIVITCIHKCVNNKLQCGLFKFPLKGLRAGCSLRQSYM